ncbi:hypothetical protein AOQ84DRAFT_180532 [Glonium stellatum]|uniref:Uncharacterized protein n=1 Tax=Glonium stellatum TaxID=574774 RepID=A0A8E2JW49_9PEZI|nr:hypothetical protein AOQ84DRAFT_180532 [Glonium stellatum]
MSLKKTPPILSLPLELREQIYGDVLLYSRKDAQFLRVCHQIYMEAQPFIFKRHLKFISQAELHRWLGIVDTQNLHHVTSISLQLQDIDLSPLLSPLPNQDAPQLLCWDLYEKELENLARALRKLPNIRSFAILKPKPSQMHSYLYREFLCSFSALVGKCYLKLRHLTLHEDQQTLAFLVSMQSLRKFRFSGSSITSPAETLSILSQMPQLTELEIFTQPHVKLVGEYRPDPSYGRYQSLTPDVLRSIRPLKSFAIHERSGLDVSATAFFNPAIFDALRDSHGFSLRTLRLSLDFTPDLSSFSAFRQFITESSVQHLEIDWPDLEPEALDGLLPRSLRSLCVSVESSTSAFDVIWEIIRSKLELPALHEVAIVADWELLEYYDDTSKVYDILPDELELAMIELRALGVRTFKSNCQFLGTERGFI